MWLFYIISPKRWQGAFLKLLQPASNLYSISREDQAQASGFTTVYSLEYRYFWSVLHTHTNPHNKHAHTRPPPSIIFLFLPLSLHFPSYTRSISPLQFPSVQMKYIWHPENAPQQWGTIYLTNITRPAVVHVIFIKGMWQWVMSTMFTVNRLSIPPKCTSTCQLFDRLGAWPIQRLIYMLHNDHGWPDHIWHACPIN